MKNNLKITFKDTKSASHVIAFIEQKYDRFRRKHQDIIRCRVVVDRPHKKHGEADHYRITTTLIVPGKELVGHSKKRSRVSRDLFKGVGEAFAALRSQLEHHSAHIHNSANPHEISPMAVS